jgi:hypothetical protein
LECFNLIVNVNHLFFCRCKKISNEHSFLDVLVQMSLTEN